METASTNFTPQDNGFKFRNSFEFPSHLGNFLPFTSLIPVDMKDVVYGLCGGMCSAALDYFYTGIPLPADDDVDDISFKLFLYLWNRQLDTLKPFTLRKIFNWMGRDDLSLVRSMKPWQIRKVRQDIDQGDPVILALIRSTAISQVTNNHQVLATGYQYDPASQEMTIFLYDPNWPEEETSLTMDLSTPSQGINLQHSKNGTQRGFFKIDYVQETPP